MSAERTVVAPDLRGHGGSSRPGSYRIDELAADIVAVAERVVGEVGDGLPIDVVGHSLGGLVALMVAHDRPDLVRRLVPEDVPVPHPRRPDPPTAPDTDPGYDWDMVVQVRGQIDDPDAGWADVARDVTAPSLVVWGGPQSPMPEEHVRQMSDTLANGRLVQVDAGHLVHALDPRGYLAVVRPFLDDP